MVFGSSVGRAFECVARVLRARPGPRGGFAAARVSERVAALNDASRRLDGDPGTGAGAGV